MMHIAFLLAYFLGSIPCGLLVTRLLGLTDPRRVGSGNIGATNVMRTGNKKAGVATLLLDGLKGAAAVWLTAHLAPGEEAYGALLAVAGHVWPVWLGFKGGKGVATSLGALLALMPLTGLCIAGTWLAMFALMRISSLSALTAFGCAPIFALLLEEPPLPSVALLLAVLIFYTHRSNIQRLINREEGRLGKPGI